MIKDGVKTVVLYLEDWQKRMVKDFLGADCDTYEVKLEGEPILRYGIPSHLECKRMYFTGWQMREMKDIAGVCCEFIELCKETPVPMYMVRPTQP